MSLSIENLVQKYTDSGSYTILSQQQEHFSLIKQEHQLLLIGSKEELKKGITGFLQGTLMENFRMVRSLYHHKQAKDLVLDALTSTPDKITDVLKDHYGPFTYSPYESAFDEYLISMREVYGITYNKQQIFDHAGVQSTNDFQKMGYNGIHQYVYDRVTYPEREQLLIANGGFSYLEWVQKEIDRFVSSPALLFREYSCVFENLFPDTVYLNKEVFIQRLLQMDLNLITELIFGTQARLFRLTDGNTECFCIKDIPLKLEQYWRQTEQGRSDFKTTEKVSI